MLLRAAAVRAAAAATNPGLCVGYEARGQIAPALLL
jgi:hypothetical protein